MVNIEASVCMSALMLFCKVWGIFWPLSLCVGSHEGRHVSSVGFGLRRGVFTWADDERTTGTGDRQRMQQYSPHAAPAGRGDAGVLQAPGLLGVYRDCWRRRTSVSMKWHHRSLTAGKNTSVWHSWHVWKHSVERICAPNGLITPSFEFVFKLVRRIWNTFVSDSAINSYFVIIFWHSTCSRLRVGRVVCSVSIGCCLFFFF